MLYPSKLVHRQYNSLGAAKNQSFCVFSRVNCRIPRANVEVTNKVKYKNALSLKNEICKILIFIVGCDRRLVFTVRHAFDWRTERYGKMQSFHG